MTGRVLDVPANRRLIDLMRGVAILQVVLFHVIHGILRFAPPGDLPGFIDRMPGLLDFTWQAFGVDLIFLVSALLLCIGLIEEHMATGRIDLRAYLVKRVSRILPLYYLAVVFYGLAQGSPLWDVLLSAFFIGYVVSNTNVIGVGWTMEVMVLVYIALPFVVRCLFRVGRPGLWIAAAFVATSLVRYLYILPQPEDMSRLYTDMIATKDVTVAGFELYFRLWFRLPPFVAGLALAWLLVRHPGLRDWLAARRGARLALTGLGFALIWGATGLPVQDASAWIFSITRENFWELYWAFAIPVFSIGVVFLILAGFAAAERNIAARLPGPWQLLSRNIFPIYLFHMVFVLLGAVVVFRSTDAAALGTATVWHVLGIFAIAATASLLLGMLLTRFIEQPAQRWLRRRVLGTR